MLIVVGMNMGWVQGWATVIFSLPFLLFATPAGYLLSPANVGPDATDSDNVAGSTGNYTLV